MTARALPPLLAHSLALELVIMLRRVGTTAPTPELLERHLRWVTDREREGAILLSGPIDPASRPLHGMTLIRAGTVEEAELIARQDPFVIEGVVVYDLHRWTALEGSLTLTATISNGRWNIG